MHIDPTHLDASAAAVRQHSRAAGLVRRVCPAHRPETFFGAFAEGDVLPVLFMAILCGFGLSKIGRAGQSVLNVINSFSHLLFAVFGYLMRLAPLGAFGAMAFTVGKYGIKSIGSLGMLIATFYLACGSSWCRARPPRPYPRLEPVAAAALLPRGAADRARHLVQRTRAAPPAA